MAMINKTTPANIAKIEAFLDLIQNLMLNLYDRWQDEKEYEDIADYAIPLRKHLPEGWTLQVMTKRPFGFKFDIGTEAVYTAFVKASGYGWSRIADAAVKPVARKATPPSVDITITPQLPLVKVSGDMAYDDLAETLARGYRQDGLCAIVAPGRAEDSVHVYSWIPQVVTPEVMAILLSDTTDPRIFASGSLVQTLVDMEAAENGCEK